MPVCGYTQCVGYTREVVLRRRSNDHCQAASRRQQLRRDDPKEEVERLNLSEGDTLSVEVRKLVLKPEMAPDVRAAFEESWAHDQAAYEYLTDR